MVSNGVVALLLAVAVQAAQGFYVNNAACGCAPQVEVGCCPGPVVEKKFVTNKAVTVPYCYSVPTYSKQCYTQCAGVDKKVIPSAFETTPVCETSETVVKVPTTDVEVNQQPLCKKTCTTSEYVIQIPIVETTCTSSPLCKRTVKTQSNVLTTCARKTACAKQVCCQNQVIETPLTNTVCQNYQGAINKVGTQTVLKPEVHKSCVQLPPYKCLKPAGTSAVSVTPYGTGLSYGAGVYGAEAYGTGAYGTGLSYAAGAYGTGLDYAAGAYGPGLNYGVGTYANGLSYGGAYPYAGAYADGVAYGGAYPYGGAYDGVYNGAAVAGVAPAVAAVAPAVAAVAPAVAAVAPAAYSPCSTCGCA